MAKVVVVDDDDEEEEIAPKPVSWYNNITSSKIDKWRIWPRLLITLYGVMFFRTTEWFMSLPEPSNAQSAFISVIVGAGAAWFGLYCGSGGSSSGDE